MGNRNSNKKGPITNALFQDLEILIRKPGVIQERLASLARQGLISTGRRGALVLNLPDVDPSSFQLDFAQYFKWMRDFDIMALDFILAKGRKRSDLLETVGEDVFLQQEKLFDLMQIDEGFVVVFRNCMNYPFIQFFYVPFTGSKVFIVESC